MNSGYYSNWEEPIKHGPINEWAGEPVAIGFCFFCYTNARRTTSTHGLFDCPKCFNYWYDERVGEQSYILKDFVRN